MGALITIPVNIILVGLFKTIAPSRKEKKRLRQMRNRKIINDKVGVGGEDAGSGATRSSISDEFTESSDSSDSDDFDDAENDSREGGSVGAGRRNVEMDRTHQGAETSLITGTTFFFYKYCITRIKIVKLLIIS